MFGTVLISVITLMHVYVFWRATSVPFLNSFLQKKYIAGTGLLLWVLFFVGRVYGHGAQMDQGDGRRARGGPLSDLPAAGRQYGSNRQ